MTVVFDALLAAALAAAGDSWLSSFDPPYEPTLCCGEVAGAAATPDGGIAVLDLCGHLTKIDSQGVVEWSRSVGLSCEGHASPRLLEAGPLGELLVASDLADYDGLALQRFSEAGVEGPSIGLGIGTGFQARPLFLRARASGGYALAAGVWVGVGPSVLWLDHGAWSLAWQDLYAFAMDVTPDDGILLAGNDATVPEGPPYLMKVDAAGALEWAYTYEAPRAASPDAVAATTDGGAVLAGHTERGPFAWILRTDAMGGLVWAHYYGSGDLAGRRSRISSLRRVEGLGFVAAGTADDKAFAMLLDEDGAVIAQNSVLGFEVLDIEMASDGDFYAVIWESRSPSAPRRLVWRTDADLGTDASCMGSSPALVAADYPFAPPRIFRPTSAPAWTPGPTAFPRASESWLGGERICGTPCASPPASAVTGLAAVRTGPDVRLTWTAEPTAGGYGVWSVRDKSIIELARASGSPLATGVSGCSVPSPARARHCNDSGAIARDAPSVLFYQVRAFCDGAGEGP